ncbi:hypothetical protein [Rubripirellula reticaptiva]|uniref:Uncharacterized protein n=1 Tax=Rubripirellula reticaptiva TaxID=2528013 RepID=A0A5C6F8Y9_9BACT|nr:hypothetical protein [Rubripirellula reticaptiva]TWU57815.1 hypothetical protein Poly59_07240 [Rubripirellula reticaptiva]
MSCAHLKKLYDLCAKEDIKIGASDLVRIVCKQCGEQESCPTLLMDHIDDDSVVEDKPAKSTS